MAPAELLSQLRSGMDVLLCSRVCPFSHRPKSDTHQSPPSDKHSIQSGKSATKTNKNSHISRCVSPSQKCGVFITTHFLLDKSKLVSAEG